MRQVVKELPQAVEDKSAEEHQRADQSIEGPTRDTAVSDHDLCVRHFKGRAPVKHLADKAARNQVATAVMDAVRHATPPSHY